MPLIAAYTLPDRFLMVFCCLWCAPPPTAGRLLLQPQDRVFSDSLRPVGRLHVCRKDLGEVLVRMSLHFKHSKRILHWQNMCPLSIHTYMFTRLSSEAMNKIIYNSVYVNVYGARLRSKPAINNSCKKNVPINLSCLEKTRKTNSPDTVIVLFLFSPESIHRQLWDTAEDGSHA